MTDHLTNIELELGQVLNSAKPKASPATFTLLAEHWAAIDAGTLEPSDRLADAIRAQRTVEALVSKRLEQARAALADLADPAPDPERAARVELAQQELAEIALGLRPAAREAEAFAVIQDAQTQGDEAHRRQAKAGGMRRLLDSLEALHARVRARGKAMVCAALVTEAKAADVRYTELAEQVGQALARCVALRELGADVPAFSGGAARVLLPGLQGERLTGGLSPGADLLSGDTVADLAADALQAERARLAEAGILA